MNDFVLYEVPISICIFALPFTGLLSKPLKMLLGIVEGFVLVIFLLALIVLFIPWILYTILNADDFSSVTPEYRKLMTKNRKAERYFRKSLQDFKVLRDNNTWPHVEITIATGAATVIIHDRTHSGIKLEPVRYVYRMIDNKIIKNTGEVITKDDFQNEIDDLLSPHAIEPPV